MTDTEAHAGLYLERVTITNFRGIGKCTLQLEPDLTVLVGRNNVGKSRLLRAIGVAAGGVIPDRDDLTIGAEQQSTIDVVVAPLGSQGEDEQFDDRTGRVLRQTQPIQEDPIRERFAWRTTIEPSLEGIGVRSFTSVMTFDVQSQQWTTPQNSSSLTADQRAIVWVDLIETRRDLVDDLLRSSSPIRRILDDLEIDDALRDDIESRLEDLGSRIVSESASLKAVKAALTSLTNSIAGIGTPSIQPLPIRLEELARSVSIAMDNGNGELPIRLHGAGSRSLASLQIRRVLYERRIGRDRKALRPHSVTLVEEPEAHLHPQAQFELADLLTAMHGQKIVSTHSSHLVSMVDPLAIRVLNPTSDALSCVSFRGPEGASGAIDDSAVFLMEIEKIKRLIERPFGELLFASAVVIGDGATERALLPPLIRHALGASSSGICVVDPGSMNQPASNAVVKFAQRIGIPWYLFSDSDAAGLAAATRLDTDHGSGDQSHIVWVSTPGSSNTCTEAVLIAYDRAMCADVCSGLGYVDGTDDLEVFMNSHKGTLGSALARRIIEARADSALAMADPAYWPAPIFTLLQKLQLAPHVDGRDNSSCE